MIWLVLTLWLSLALGIVAFLRGADERKAHHDNHDTER